MLRSKELACGGTGWLAIVNARYPQACESSVEHEDADYSRLDGLALAAENLRAAAAKM